MAKYSSKLVSFFETRLLCRGDGDQRVQRPPLNRSRCVQRKSVYEASSSNGTIPVFISISHLRKCALNSPKKAGKDGENMHALQTEQTGEWDSFLGFNCSSSHNLHLTGNKEVAVLGCNEKTHSCEASIFNKTHIQSFPHQ